MKANLMKRSCLLFVGIPATALIFSTISPIQAADYPAYPDNSPGADERESRSSNDEREDEGRRRSRARIVGVVTRVINDDLLEIATDDDRRVRILTRGLGSFQPKVGD